MAVKGLDARQELPIVADGDEHLGVRPHGGLEDREGAGGELVLLYLGDLIFPRENGWLGACSGKWGLGGGLQAALEVGRGGREAGERGEDVRELVSGLREKFSAAGLAGGLATTGGMEAYWIFVSAMAVVLDGGGGEGSDSASRETVRSVGLDCKAES